MSRSPKKAPSQGATGGVPHARTHRAVTTAIKAYHTTLQRFSERGVKHEGATETAFGRLLADTAGLHRWTLIPKQSITIGGHRIVPDGTLEDEFRLPRGYWEAKDTDDDLEIEIGKKIDKKYPLINTIFEDTRRAVLFQNEKQTAWFDLNSARAWRR
jgi:hypothetical protein